MHQINAEIISNRKVGPAHFKMALKAPLVARAAKPGQFIHVRCSEGLEPLLRRPFSIHRVYKLKIKNEELKIRDSKSKGYSPDIVEVIYKVVGRGTEILSNRKSGQRLDLIGPLGNSFDLGPKTDGRGPTDEGRGAMDEGRGAMDEGRGASGKGRGAMDDGRWARDEGRRMRDEGRGTTILMAGGMGVAPLLWLAEEIVHSPQRPTVHSRGLYAIIGAKTKKEVFCAQEFKKLGFDVHIATDDGSMGFKGFATDFLKRFLLSTIDYGLSTIYACGPKAMLKEVAGVSTKGKVPCQASLEENMGCGVGACLGCAVRTKSGYKMVCEDGPVFNLDQVVFE